MKHYTCDNGSCGATISKPTVVLCGITGTSGGILLPEQFHEKHFCSPEYFWEWIDIYHPNGLRMSSAAMERAIRKNE